MPILARSLVVGGLAAATYSLSPALLLTAGCAKSPDAAAGGQSVGMQATAGATSSSGSGGSAAKSGSPAAGASATAGRSATAGATSSAAGASTAGTAAGAAPAAGASGTASGTSGARSASTAGTPANAGMPAPMGGPQMCNGKPLPPRALGADPPFDVGPKAAGLPEYWPTDDWRMETPDKLGFDAAKLTAAAEFSTSHSNTQAMFIVRHGYVALEKYSGGFSATQQHESYSMAKSFSSGLVGIATAEGKIKSIDDKICASYPMQWDCSDTTDPRSRITISHAMNLMTGLRWSEDWRSTATGANDAYNLNLLDAVLAREAVEEPGMRKRYSTGDPSLLSGVLQGATGMTALAYAKAKIFDVIGIPGVRWNADTKGRTTTYAGLQATAREYAKYGYLYLQRGLWDGKQVIPSEYIDLTTQAKDRCEGWNQYLWHVNMPVRLGPQDAKCDGIFCTPTDYVNLPHDGYFAEGVNGQFVFIIPSADLVIVRLAADDAGSEFWDEYARGFLLAIMDSLR